MDYGLAPQRSIFLERNCPTDIEELCVFLEQRTAFPKGLSGLRYFCTRHPEFIAEILPFLWQQAQEFVDIPAPIHAERSIRITQRDALRILVHSFFCSFERDSYHWDEYPSINMDRLFSSAEPLLYGKICMIHQYFSKQKKRWEQGDALERELIFLLQNKGLFLRDWKESTKPLQLFTVHPLGQSIDDAKDCFRVDFANQYLGGAALSHGCVQEEIMFMLLPELNAGRLFCARMRDEETIVMQGAEQFSLPKGYGWSFENGGTYDDPTPIVHNMLQSHIVAMDAVDYRYDFPSEQYTEAHILRDLNKAYSGFATEGAPHRIATGNWGCGVFLGDASFKALLQWASAAQAGCCIEYFPFDHQEIAIKYPALTKSIYEQGVTVGQIVRFLCSIDPKESVVSQLQKWIETPF